VTGAGRFTFPAETVAFLTDLRAHNDKAWFEANRARYQAAYVDPAVAFVSAVAADLDAIVPGIRAEPKVLGSIFRIHRDTRFSTDKRPYKDHLDLWFWEGARKTAVSGLFLRVAPDDVVVGAGAHGFAKDQLVRYRDAITTARSGAEIATIVEGLERAGHEVGGQTSTRPPRGYPPDGPAARLLRHRALFVHAQLPIEVATAPDLVPTLMSHWTTFAPVHRWLTTNLSIPSRG
jgi:uncharacterized protein (TIGR02453 family)